MKKRFLFHEERRWITKIIKNVSKVHQKMMRMNTIYDIPSRLHTSIMKEKEEGGEKYMKYIIRKNNLLFYSHLQVSK